VIVDRPTVDMTLGTATRDALRRSVGTRPRQSIVAVTLLVGVLAAAGVASAAPIADLTIAGLSDPVQSLMSVVVPLIGILLAHDLRSAPFRLAPTLLAAAVSAAAVGLFGFVVCAGTLAVAGSTAADPWRHVSTVAVGSVLVQVVARLVGTGLGLLLRSAAVAFAVSIVLPLGLWWALGAVELLRPAQAWLTPYGTVRHLLSGQMGAVESAQWVVVALIWAVGLNAVGAARLRRNATGLPRV
jgi:hypothetical protein